MAITFLCVVLGLGFFVEIHAIHLLVSQIKENHSTWLVSSNPNYSKEHLQQTVQVQLTGPKHISKNHNLCADNLQKRKKSLLILYIFTFILSKIWTTDIEAKYVIAFYQAFELFYHH